MSLEDRLRLKLKVKTEISLCMATMLDHPRQSLYTQYGTLFLNTIRDEDRVLKESQGVPSTTHYIKSEEFPCTPIVWERKMVC